MDSSKVSKLPIFVPWFDKNLTNMVVDFIFLPDAIPSKDSTLQVMGNLAFTDSMQLEFNRTRILQESAPNRILFSGGKNKRYKNPLNLVENSWVKYLTKKIGIKWNDVLNKSEASIMSNRFMGKIDENGNPLVIWEQSSTNTKQNFEIARDRGYYGKTKKLILLAGSVSVVRAKMTALAALKGTSVDSIETISYSEQIPFKNQKLRNAFTINRETLTNGNFIAKYLARRMVWAELKRIAKYSAKGDCKFVDYVQEWNFKRIFEYINSR